MNEFEMVEMLKNSRNVLLIEPPYTRKYIPLGLAKIATFIKNCGGSVTFSRKCITGDFDLICITSLFTYDLNKVEKIIDQCIKKFPTTNIILGGVCATLMEKEILEKYNNINIFTGYSKLLDMCPPDYSIDWNIKEPWDKFSFVFTTRGCPNNCGYCAVKKLEPDLWINNNWKDHIDLSKPFVMISDNNLSAQPISHIKDIVEFLVENNKKVVFDNGFDCKHITPELADLLSTLKYTRHGMRLAFDRIEEDGTFQDAIKILLGAGIKKTHIMAYILFNFNDFPNEAIYRANECIRLGIRPYPQRYTPLNKTTKKEIFVGKHWTLNLTKAYRYFYLMAGIYTKNNFYDWIKTQDTFEISDDDMRKLMGE